VGALNRSAGFLRTRLGQGLRMRSVPELHFHHDTSVEQGAHMDAILRSLNTTPAASEDETS
jgi:ribosome-binding factor A